MTLKELQKLVNSLCKAGHGDCLVVKSSDDEGNWFDKISELGTYSAIINGREIDLLADEDISSYDDEDLSKVVCVW